MKLLISLLLLTVAADLPADSVQYTRSETQFTPSLHGVATDVASMSRHLYPDMTDAERWFVEQEILHLNWRRWTSDGTFYSWGIYIRPEDPFIVPVYQRSSQFFCGDLRNWMVAVMKGRKYGVSPALMIAVRSHENPKESRDWYAYGVKHLRGTNLWTQADGAARIIARISAAQGWPSLSPARSDLYSLGATYCVGVAPSRLSANGRDRTSHWSRCVWTFYRRTQ